MLTPQDQLEWRRSHIPHRVRAAIARLDMTKSVLAVVAVIDPMIETKDDKINWRCATDAIWEGRIAATRWLIEFVGIREKHGNPAGPKAGSKKSCDIDISHFSCGPSGLFDLKRPEAKDLAMVWKGCSQATSHATYKSGHPSVNDEQLSGALAQILEHLQDRLYQPEGELLCACVLQPDDH